MGTLTANSSLFPGRTLSSILNRARTENLKVGKSSTDIINRRHQNKIYAAKVEQFITELTPESIYLLGFAWADGTIRGGGNGLRFCNLEDDMLELKPVFEKTGEWKFYNMPPRERSPNPRVCAVLTSKRLHNYLFQNGYFNKSEGYCPIFSRLNEEQQALWFRGYFDGDGCWSLYKRKEGNARSFCITSELQQNWDFIVKWLTLQGIEFRINLERTQHGSCSRLSSASIQDVSLLGEILYKSYLYDKIGLSRKYRKWQEIYKDIIGDYWSG